METLNVRAGFLCNHEVLTILKAQRDARGVEVKALLEAKAQRVAKLGRRPFQKELEDDEIARLQPGDLATVTFECIKYLEEDVHPLRRQSTAAITKLLEDLEKLDLTKAERLQIINLAPTTLVALVVCVDDFEERFPSEEEQAHILDLVREHLTSEAAAATGAARKAGRMDVDQDEAEEEEQPFDEEEEEEFVEEGLQGAGEDQGKELDEVAD